MMAVFEKQLDSGPLQFGSNNTMSDANTHVVDRCPDVYMIFGVCDKEIVSDCVNYDGCTAFLLLLITDVLSFWMVCLILI